MKRIKPLLSSLFVCLLLMTQSSAYAGTLHYIPDNGNGADLDISCICDRIGSVAIPRGRLVIRSQKAEVTTIPEFQFDRVPVLDGSLIMSSLTANGNSGKVSGLLYFSEGPWLSYLGSPAQTDILSTTDGEVSGHITNIENGQIEIETLDGKKQAIAFSKLKSIQSPRAINFSLDINAQNPITSQQEFSAETARTALQVQTSGKNNQLSFLQKDLKKESDGDMGNGKITAIVAATSIVQIAQIAPLLALSLSSSGYRRQAYYKQLNTLTGPQMPNMGTIFGAPGVPVVNPVYPGFGY